MPAFANPNRESSRLHSFVSLPVYLSNLAARFLNNFAILATWPPDERLIGGRVTAAFSVALAVKSSTARMLYSNPEKRVGRNFLSTPKKFPFVSERIGPSRPTR